MKKLFLALLVVMIGGTLGVGIAYDYTHPMLTKWGDSYQTCTFYVQDTFGSTSKTQFADAVIHWNNQLTKSPPFLYKSSSDTSLTQPQKNGTKTVTKRYIGYGYVAVCERYLDATNTYVIETDIDLNTYWQFANSAQPGCYDVQSIFTHELGHVLRIGESTVYADTMYSTAKLNNTDNRTVTTADRDAARDSTARWFQ